MQLLLSLGCVAATEAFAAFFFAATHKQTSPDTRTHTRTVDALGLYVCMRAYMRSSTSAQQLSLALTRALCRLLVLSSCLLPFYI